MPATIDWDLVMRQPHLASPMNLAIADGELMKRPYLPSPHLSAINNHFVRASVTPDARLAINVPFRHGKTVLVSNYGIAWLLLHNPQLKIMSLCFSDGFAEKKIGQPCRDILERWGKPLGITIRKDSKAKGDWMIQGHDGGLLCRGRGGSTTGRDADVLNLDDLIQNPKEAMSATIMEGMWDWYIAVAQARLGPGAPVMSVGTRWGRNDWFARIKEYARISGEVWTFIRYPAMAEENDPLGRKVGEPLFPERVSLKRLEQLKAAEGRWFQICWQQHDQEDEEGSWLQPNGSKTRNTQPWPRYQDFGNVFSIERPGCSRRLVQKNDCIILFAADWAYSIRRTGDSSAIIAGAVTPPYMHNGEVDSDLLILEARKRKLKPEQLAPECDDLCRIHHPVLGGIEEGHPTIKDDVRRFKHIPSIRWLAPQGSDKLQRAMEAIVAGQRGRIVLPAPDTASKLERPWMDEYVKTLTQFTGVDEGPDTDDLVDATSWLAKLWRQYRPSPRSSIESYDWMNEPLTPGANSMWGNSNDRYRRFG